MRGILLCDDRPDELMEIEGLIRRYYTQKRSDSKIYICHDPKEALGCCKEHNPNAAILDIVMPGMSGVQLAKTLRASGYDGVIVFLTSVNDFAAESYEVGASDYLLKPVSVEKLYMFLDSLEKTDESQIAVTRRGSTHFLSVRELMYVEVMRNKLYFHMKSGDTLDVNAALKEYIGTLLSFKNMAQCHISFVVNMNFINTLDRTSLTLTDGSTLPVARSQHGFREKCLDWLFGKGAN